MFVAPQANNQNTAAPAQANGNGTKQPRTTVAYVSAFLPLSDGTRVKLFSDLTLRLYAEKTAENKVVELIKQGVITPEQLAKLIQIEVSLARDENAPIEIDLSAIGL